MRRWSGVSALLSAKWKSENSGKVEKVAFSHFICFKTVGNAISSDFLSIPLLRFPSLKLRLIKVRLVKAINSELVAAVSSMKRKSSLKA